MEVGARLVGSVSSTAAGSSRTSKAESRLCTRLILHESNGRDVVCCCHKVLGMSQILLNLGLEIETKGEFVKER